MPSAKRDRIRDALDELGPSTANQIAQATDLTRHQVAKLCPRMSDVYRAGERKGRYNGDTASIWGLCQPMQLKGQTEAACA